MDAGQGRGQAVAQVQVGHHPHRRVGAAEPVAGQEALDLVQRIAGRRLQNQPAVACARGERTGGDSTYGRRRGCARGVESPDGRRPGEDRRARPRPARVPAAGRAAPGWPHQSELPHPRRAPGVRAARDRRGRDAGRRPRGRVRRHGDRGRPGHRPAGAGLPAAGEDPDHRVRRRRRRAGRAAAHDRDDRPGRGDAAAPAPGPAGAVRRSRPSASSRCTATTPAGSAWSCPRRLRGRGSGPRRCARRSPRIRASRACATTTS